MKSTSETTVKCIGRFTSNPGKGILEITSPKGNTISFRLDTPPVSNLTGQESIDFYYIVGSVKRAWQARQKWENEHKPKDDDKTKWKAYSARLAHWHPAGMSFAYVNLTINEMQVLLNIHKRK